jgi:hypothetical protein
MAAGERRRFARYTAEAMYSAVAVRAAFGSHDDDSDDSDSCAVDLEGHLYDISLGGARFELDEAIPVGSCVTLALSLPGLGDAVEAEARIVRVFDELDDPGPRRMAVAFESFAGDSRARLARHLAEKWLRLAPIQPRRSAASIRSARASGARSSRKTSSASAA